MNRAPALNILHSGLMRIMLILQALTEAEADVIGTDLQKRLPPNRTGLHKAKVAAKMFVACVAA